jgi:hypothetical protein
VVEWLTVWSFAFAAVVIARLALRETRSQGLRAGWLFGVALFCLFVALEEISWGQRLLGARPPRYFLERNFQQELNLHNVASQGLRRWALIAVIGGYGLALPLLLRVPRASQLARRLGVFAPPLALAPVFALALALYLWYPLEFSGEIVEATLGLAFLFTGWLWQREAGVLRGGTLRKGGALLLLLAAGAASAAASLSESDSPEQIAAAERELLALAEDLAAAARESSAAPTGCGLHSRLYGFVMEHEVAALREKRFAALAAEGADPERIAYFLDPWNSPYWVRDHCGEAGERSVFVYSFGPNRRRDSSEREIGGDDLGVYLARQP